MTKPKPTSPNFKKETKSKPKKKLILVPHWGVVVKTSSYSEVTREPDPDDQWDREDLAHSLSVESIEPSVDDKFDLAVPFDLVAGETYYLVTVFHSTGDSFHHETGCSEIIDLFKDEDSAKLCKLTIEEHYNMAKGERYSTKPPVVKPKDFNDFSLVYQDAIGNDKVLSVGWTGYFEGLEDVRIDSLTYTPKVSLQKKSKMKK